MVLGEWEQGTSGNACSKRRDVRKCAMTITNQLTIERGTLYFRTECGYRRTEARAIEAQIFVYEFLSVRAISVAFTEKGCRKRSALWINHSRLVILDGWGHPELKRTPAQPASRLTPTKSRSGRRRATDPRPPSAIRTEQWDQEFDTLLTNHLAATGAKVLADFRHLPAPRCPSVKDLTPDMTVVVVGVTDGRSIPREKWPVNNFPRQVFANLAAAQVVFPDLNLNSSSHGLNGPMVGVHQGVMCTQFETQAVTDSFW